MIHAQPKKIALGSFAAAMIALGTVQAATVVNNGDSWTRESSPTSSFAGDLISVWNSNSSDGARRYGVLSFDLSSLTDPITAVSLSIHNKLNGFSDDGIPLKQSAIAIDPTGINADAATWNQVTAAANLHTFGGLGNYDIPPTVGNPSIQDVYLQSVGSAADAAFVESVRTGSGTLMVLMIADEGGVNYSNSWSDAECCGGQGPGLDAFLATNSDVPEPASFALLGLSGLLLLRRRR